MWRRFLVAAACMLVMTACGQVQQQSAGPSPVAGPAASAASSGTAAMKHDQAVPFKGTVEGLVGWVLTDACQPYQPVKTVSNVTGNMTHLGLTSLRTEHCASGMLALLGRATFTAANGDQVWGSYTATTTAPPPVLTQKAELIIEGGTGRFEHATGTVPFMVYVWITPPVTTTSTFPIRLVFDGSIAY